MSSFKERAVNIAAASGSVTTITSLSDGYEYSLSPAEAIARNVEFVARYDQPCSPISSSKFVRRKARIPLGQRLRYQPVTALSNEFRYDQTRDSGAQRHELGSPLQFARESWEYILDLTQMPLRSQN